MTEIPEHLLQRSRERRAALGGGGDGDGGGDEAASPSESSAAPAATPAAAAPASMPAHPAPAEPEPPKPDSPPVAAFKARRKVPFWAMPVLAALPVWAYMFVGTLEPPPQETPLTVGEDLYAASCATCHGATGGGGVGPAFGNGEIFATWPDFEGHFEWVRLGSAGWQAEYGDTYGANETAIAGGMPGFEEGAISDAELVFILLAEREEFGGDNPNPEDHARLAALAELMFEDEELHLYDDEETGEPGALTLLEEAIANEEIALEDYMEE